MRTTKAVTFAFKGERFLTITFADHKNKNTLSNGQGRAKKAASKTRPPAVATSPVGTLDTGGRSVRVSVGRKAEGCVCAPSPPLPASPHSALTLSVLFLALSCCSSWEIWLAEFSRSLVRLAWSLCTSSTSWAISRSLAANSTSRLERVSTSMACSWEGERR